MKENKIYIGASWYPEMWPAREWPKDILKIKELGFNIVRLFEFAWKRFEPSEGAYDFSWSIEILDQLHDAGIQVMLGTPTAAPPAWLTSNYPDVLGTDARLIRKTHGKRKHYNHHSQTYRRFAQSIVSAMVEHLGKHPAVHSWQIDNEMSGFDYGDETRKHFHLWLENKYKTIENLNETWGLNFWSQAYDSFSQIPLCTAEVGSVEIPERHHPSLIMAIARFQNEAWTDFIKAQCDIIRASCPHPITTNMTGFVGQMDWFSHFKQLDRAGLSTYADLDHFTYNYIKFERLRAEKQDPFWLLETAPNWSGGGPVWNIHNNEAGIRALSWASVLAGGSMVLYWQFRSHWAGQEMQHGTCVSQTGKWMPGKETWSRLAEEFSRFNDILIHHPTQRGPVAILADCANAWLFSIDPIDPSNKYETRLRDDYYLPLLRSHFHRDIIHSAADFSPYSIIVCPNLSILTEDTKARLNKWVEEGGQLLLGPMVGNRTEEMTAWTEEEFGGLEQLIGGRSSIRFSPHWVENTIKVLFEDGSFSHPRIWCEGFEALDNTEVLAKYQGGYGDGHAAILMRSFGIGKVITVGCPIDESSYIKLINLLAGNQGVRPLLEKGSGVCVSPRVDLDGNVKYIGLVNSSKSATSVVWQFSGKDLLSNRIISEKFDMAPLEVLLIEVS